MFTFLALALSFSQPMFVDSVEEGIAVLVAPDGRAYHVGATADMREGAIWGSDDYPVDDCGE